MEKELDRLKAEVKEIHPALNEVQIEQIIVAVCKVAETVCPAFTGSSAKTGAK